MNTIIVEYDTFSYESKVTIYRNSEERGEPLSVRSNIKDMANKIAEYAYNNKIYDIRFHGPGLIRDEFEASIKNVERNLYSENKITVREI